jgi:NAD(P)-dependent dehydrogenase (short-subunit alcohol dehydrogenase family)
MAKRKSFGIIRGSNSLSSSGGEPNRVERVKEYVPMKRGGQPAEIARAILWLLSDEASYSTGAILDLPAAGSQPSAAPARNNPPGCVMR